MIAPATPFRDRRDQAIGELVAEALRAGREVKFRALGSSMIPAVWPGDVLTARPVNTAFPRIGEIALTMSDRGLRAHRVVERRESGQPIVIVTRGDALPASDPIGPASAVLGTIVARNGRPLGSGSRNPLPSLASRIAGCAPLRWLRLKT
ncbi:MAG: S24/S26 family peptidase, partial [Candidatus Binataceae bacterium]